MIVSMTAISKPFVVDSWLRSSVKLQPNRSVQRSVHNVSFGNMVLKLLETNVTLVLHDDDDYDHFIGWISFSGTCIDMCYIKKALRNLGHGSQLLDKSGCNVRSCSVSEQQGRFFRLLHDPWNVTNRLLIKGDS